MSTSVWTLTLTALLGGGPLDWNPFSSPSFAPPAGSTVMAQQSFGEVPPEGVVSEPYLSESAIYHGEQLYPFDAPDPWMHGYFQRMPAYGGFHHFRPYNYKHVLSQSQAAGGWGMSPTMPYSQQFWHRYQDEASMEPPPLASPEEFERPRPPQRGRPLPRRKPQSPNPRQYYQPPRPQR